jgi:hypothetical protein
MPQLGFTSLGRCGSSTTEDLSQFNADFRPYQSVSTGARRIKSCMNEKSYPTPATGSDRNAGVPQDVSFLERTHRVRFETKLRPVSSQRDLRIARTNAFLRIPFFSIPRNSIRSGPSSRLSRRDVSHRPFSNPVGAKSVLTFSPTQTKMQH